MKNIGADFDTSRYYGKLDLLKEDMKYFKQIGIKTFDFFWSNFLEEDKHVDEVIEYLVENDIKVTIHSVPVDGVWTTVKSDKENEEAIKINKDAMRRTREKLLSYGIDYRVPVVFHSGYYKDIDKQTMMDYNVKFYKEIAKEAGKYNFDILAETLSLEHPHTDVVGNVWSDIEYLVANIDDENFGICWDMGHTHLNFLEHGQEMMPTEEVTKKIRHTHIHNLGTGHVFKHDDTAASSHTSKYKRFMHDRSYTAGRDHYLLEDNGFQDEEIKWLLDNGYEGTFNAEYGYELIMQAGAPYKRVLESFKLLREKVNKYSVSRAYV